MASKQQTKHETPKEPDWTFGPGEVLGGSYRVKRRLAVGGMGEVYLCRHTRLPGHYVAKVLTKELNNSDENYARFRREAEILATLRHPNVVQVIDFNFTPSGAPYLVMEYLDGEDLSVFVEPRKPFGPRRTARIIKQVASALQAAHDVGIVHRDLKPENVVLISAPGQDNFVKVIDFGISISHKTSRVTAHEVLMGTPHFMSPEQAQGQREIDGRSDQFSLAIMAYLLLTGDLPFDAQTPVAVLYAVVNSPIRPFPASVPQSVASVISRALSKLPDDRYATVMAFAQALEDAINASVDLTATSLEPMESIRAIRIGPQRSFETTVNVRSRRASLWNGFGLAILGLAVGAITSWVLLSRFDVRWESVQTHARAWFSAIANRISLFAG
ncbi:MAG: serine/threonine-protein kinase [Deltaproteobacteria bacterium]|nr:serine/threonine-protein kinase [Deltaproteobacteria bacterium]